MTRSRAWAAMVAATPRNELSLPRCAACWYRFYPPQAHCPACLHGQVEYAPDSGEARVVSATTLHHTFDAQRFDALPVHVLTVRTESGVSLFALADKPIAVDTDVILTLVVDDKRPEGEIRARPKQE